MVELLKIIKGLFIAFFILFIIHFIGGRMYRLFVGELPWWG